MRKMFVFWGKEERKLEEGAAKGRNRKERNKAGKEKTEKRKKAVKEGVKIRKKAGKTETTKTIEKQTNTV